MPDYQDIYNDVASTDDRYKLAEHSPGFRAVLQATDALSLLSGRSLDLGCGVGFAVEYLSRPPFQYIPFGIDISDVMIERAKLRLQGLPDAPSRLSVVEDQVIPFEDDFFSLVTCFDMLEHLDRIDMETSLSEIQRVLSPGGLFFGTVSCRPAGIDDKHGDNLHRTVESASWWIDRIKPDRAVYDGHRQQLSVWKRLPTEMSRGDSGSGSNARSFRVETKRRRSNGDSCTHANPEEFSPVTRRDDAEIANGKSAVDVGKQLLSDYLEWLIEPVLELGCGLGEVVEQLRQSGLRAEGIDTFQHNLEMRVGDISGPIQGLDEFNSAICIDRIHDLDDESVLGLFENMKQVKRQAFSIRNSESAESERDCPINRKDFIDWTKLIREHFDIATAIQISDDHVLYLTQAKR